MTSSVNAQNFPIKPIKILVPNAAGGAADITARTLAQKLSDSIGQQVIIENKPTAGGIAAAEQVAKSDPDGHTLLLISSGTAVSAALFKSLPFDTLKDFAPISKLAIFDLVVAVSENGRFKNITELISYAKSNPGKLNIGTPQIGTTQNLAAELFVSTAGISAQIIPFNGTPPVINALRGNNIDVMIDILGPLIPQIKGNLLRPLALMGDKRFSLLPDTPTLRELGGNFTQLSVASWNGLAAPSKTPKDVISKLNYEIQLILNSKDFITKLSDLNVTVQGSTSEQAYDLLNSEIKRWGTVIERSKIEKQ
ncbi:MAG: Bug family tripartite tricarboxylate transporter substrate binding protein [Burkholderiaceae bacterium]